MIRNGFKQTLLLFFFAVPAFELLSFQVLVTKESETIKGTIVSENADQVVFQSLEGNKRIYFRKDIAYLIYKDVSDEEYKKLSEGLSIKELQNSYLAQEPQRSRWDIVWRSALIPGWGLFHAGEKRKGFFALSTFGLFIALEVQGHKDLESRKEKYDQSSDLLNAYLFSAHNSDPLILVGLQAQKEIQRLHYENAEYKANIKSFLLAIKYLVQLGFAYYYGTKWEKGEIGTGFKFEIGRDTAGIPQIDNGSIFGVSQKYNLSYSIRF
ncbi:hypothetical protein [Leptospira stimsonii]|uniref:DUF5683 domain-containing protein n=1 Tax=Leptospira stimsonii TaxID=2202203 RepID=A0A396Z9B1_9LEPT|nr:hypothetical protein [Leptospira stimsonii]RHX90763.1 hypothetical protein DLM75_10285 [Leptospira stimsonii]